MLNKKAQSAMEYLMTYGWAILVVLIALGALFYLGVFSPRTPNSCVGSAPITCGDVKADASDDTLLLSVGASGVSSATIASVIGTCTKTTAVAGISTTMLGNIWLANTTSSTINGITCSPLASVWNTGDRVTGTLNVDYTLTGSTTLHTTTVQYSATVEA